MQCDVSHLSSMSIFTFQHQHLYPSKEKGVGGKHWTVLKGVQFVPFLASCWLFSVICFLTLTLLSIFLFFVDMPLEGDKLHIFV